MTAKITVVACVRVCFPYSCVFNDAIEIFSTYKVDYYN